MCMSNIVQHSSMWFGTHPLSAGSLTVAGVNSECVVSGMHNLRRQGGSKLSSRPPSLHQGRDGGQAAVAAAAVAAVSAARQGLTLSWLDIFLLSALAKIGEAELSWTQQPRPSRLRVFFIVFFVQGSVRASCSVLPTTAIQPSHQLCYSSLLLLQSIHLPDAHPHPILRRHAGHVPAAGG